MIDVFPGKAGEDRVEKMSVEHVDRCCAATIGKVHPVVGHLWGPLDGFSIGTQSFPEAPHLLECHAEIIPVLAVPRLELDGPTNLSFGIDEVALCNATTPSRCWASVKSGWATSIRW